MEHNEMDDLFRKIIKNDNSDLQKDEVISKKTIWNELEVNQSKKMYPFWRIAAIILFFLWGGTAWFFSNKLNHEKNIFAQLESHHEEVKNSLSAIQEELESFQFSNNQNYNEDKTEMEIPIKSQEVESPPIAKIEVIEKIKLVHDTIFIQPNITTQEIVQIVRDTVFITIPETGETKLANKEDQLIPEKMPTPTPSKIEFVFGKKPLKKPTQQNKLIIINENEVAKKTSKKNSNLISIPLKN